MIIDPKVLDKQASYKLFMSAVIPRPIALVATVDEEGVYNLAPFSSYTILSVKPPLLCLSIGVKRNGQKKDTLRNIELVKDFVVSVVDEGIFTAMTQAATDFDSSVDEFKEVGLTPLKSKLVKAPLVAESPVNMECRLRHLLDLSENTSGARVVIGEVVIVHIKDELWLGESIDGSKLKAISRMGGDLYCRTIDVFTNM